ncbi:MAG: hypothetical protein KIT84_06935 [Labilithrix sp.]|nr:hypothetical protein [Labilithrix sp.]MCW5810729.1 hypothetical protein [Labilithrix sp.]
MRSSDHALQRRLLTMAKMAAIAFVASGCGRLYPYRAPLNGTLINTTKSSQSVTENALDEPETRSAESCAAGFALFYPVSFSFGDGSAYKAAQQTRLKRVAVVDRSEVGVLGHFAKVCSVTVGSAAETAPAASAPASVTPAASATPAASVTPLPAPAAPVAPSASAAPIAPRSRGGGEHAVRCSLVCMQVTDSGATNLSAADQRQIENGLMPLLDEAARCPSSGSAANQLQLTLTFDGRGALDGVAGTTPSRGGPAAECLTSLKTKLVMSGPPGRTLKCTQYCN